MESAKDRILVLFMGYGIFLLLFVSYEYYLMTGWQVITEFRPMDFTQQSIAMLLLPFVTAIPAALIGYINKTDGALYGGLFGVMTSVSVVAIDKLVFSQILGSDVFFGISVVFSSYFIVAVLACGFGEAIAKSR